MNYESYVRVPELLRLQHPLTAEAGATWVGERFFIVCHQSAELWASQILVELRQARALADGEHWSGVDESLRRAASMTLLVSNLLAELLFLPRERFLDFRDRLDGLSAAESEQFAELLLGARQPELAILSERLEPWSGSGNANGAHPGGSCSQDPCQAWRSLRSLLEAIGAWRKLHARLARHFIGTRSGTGGTSGVAYLQSRIAEGHALPLPR